LIGITTTRKASPIVEDMESPPMFEVSGNTFVLNVYLPESKRVTYLTRRKCQKLDSPKISRLSF